jgi:hypothetical protein
LRLAATAPKVTNEQVEYKEREEEEEEEGGRID